MLDIKLLRARCDLIQWPLEAASSEFQMIHNFNAKRFAATVAFTTVVIGGIQVPVHAESGKQPGIEFELGAGGAVRPTYEGSDSYEVSPFPIVRFNYLGLKNGFEIGGGDGQGFSIRPSFRYLGSREAADDPVLTGLTDIDAAIELGIGFKYAMGPFSVFADSRYGVTGHNGLVGEIGGDYTFVPVDNLKFSLGPRASWASGDYMSSYFSVSAAESVASGLPVFNAGAGFKSVGAEAQIRYDFNEYWAAESSATFDRLIGDAGNSPVTGLGSKDQFGFKLGFVRKFRIDF